MASNVIVTNEKTEEFLEHFGVIGMKWGRRRAVYNAGGSTARERHQAESDRRIAKEGFTKSTLKTVGKSAAIGVGINVGTTVVSTLAKGHPSVQVGAKVIGTLLNAANTVSTIRDVVGLENAYERQKPARNG